MLGVCNLIKMSHAGIKWLVSQRLWPSLISDDKQTSAVYLSVGLSDCRGLLTQMLMLQVNLFYRYFGVIWSKLNPLVECN